MDVVHPIWFNPWVDYSGQRFEMARDFGRYAGSAEFRADWAVWEKELSRLWTKVLRSELPWEDAKGAVYAEWLVARA